MIIAAVPVAFAVAASAVIVESVTDSRVIALCALVGGGAIAGCIVALCWSDRA